MRVAIYMSFRHHFRDLVDIAGLEKIFQQLYQVAGVPSALIDSDGEVLAGAGWQEICLDFHRCHLDARRRCIDSDRSARERTGVDPDRQIYTCPHGLVDSCYPIVIEGAITASVFVGQFLYEPVDEQLRDRFRRQARDYGFDETAYLAALDKVPVVSPERHRQMLDLLAALAGQIAQLGMARLDERRQSTQLKDSDELLRLSLEATNDGLWDWRIGADTVYWSPRCYSMLGFPPDSFAVTATIWRELIHPDDLDTIKKQVDTVVRGSGLLSCDYRLRTASGAYLWVHGRGQVVEWDEAWNAVRMVGTHTDISERKEAEEHTRRLQDQLRQAQKLEAIGTLAGGIAHDFNNILGAMIGFTDMVIDDLPADSRHRRDLGKVLQAGHRARDLIGQILAFSRQSAARRTTLQPRTIIKEVARLLRSTLPTTIAINQSVDPGCGCIEADPSQFHQILMNLCTNAYHAMEESGGTLTLTLRPAPVLPETLRRKAERTGDAYLELLVADTGHGMSPATLAKIFDPFFTTKDKEKGTGMGLSIVYGIVAEYGGVVTVDSEEGQGATFHVFWPCSRQQSRTPAQNTEPLPGGTERILFVDDEQLLLEMTAKMLERYGYSVTSVTDGQRAYDLFYADPQRFDLVITDQTMPGMTGLELAGKLLTIRPGLPIILCTGYSAAIDEEKVKNAGLRGLIFKPLLKKDLTVLIRSALTVAPPELSGPEPAGEPMSLGE